MTRGRTGPMFSHVLLVTGARTWADEPSMRSAFRDTWLTWGPENVTRPLLLSGHCDKGADATAERLWRDAGFEVRTFPADWHRGNGAGFERNQRMVDAARHLQDAGARVLCTAFLDLCAKRACPQRARQQLLPDGPAGHFSHGTVHCRTRALAAGLTVLDAVPAGVPAG